MALIVYNKENSRPQQVVYQEKRTINMDSKGTVYLSKTMSIELGILGGGRVNFAHDEDTGEWYICHTTDKDGFTVWKDKRCARFSAGFIVRRIMLQAKVERKTVQFMIAKAPIEVGGTVYYKILLSNPISNSKKMAQKDPLSDNGDGFSGLCCLDFYIILFGALGYCLVRALYWHNTMS